MNKKLILGTANFGNVYGISNNNRSAPLVDREKAYALVNTAISLGIDTFDTAQNYGPSLEWLVDFAETYKFKIWSKVAWVGGESSNSKDFVDSISRYFDKYGSENLELLQFHNWKPDLDKSEIVERIDYVQSEWKTKVGATTYGSESALSAVRYFENIQIECNLLNKHAYLAIKEKLNRDQLLNVRSLFLQGILLKDSTDLDLKFNELKPALGNIDEIIKDSGIARKEFIIRWFHDLEGVSGLVVGADAPEQLEEIHSSFAKGALPRESIRRLESLNSLNFEMADPRNWNIS